MPPAKATRKRPSAVVSPAPEIVDPRWLLKAGAAVLALALLCAYVSVCALFYTQQGQFILHPSRSVPNTPASQGMAFQPVRFGDDASGQPQLTGWWIPGDAPTAPTVLLLHGQDGSMSNALPAARALHDAQLNVLLFDYRGYGKSGGQHPSASRMRADAGAALAYLSGNRRIPISSILPFGEGLGASLAVSLCVEHRNLPAVILESADGDTETRVLRDERSLIVPVRLLFHEKFPLADPLHTLTTPKLLISRTGGVAPEEAMRAADPKMTVEMPLAASTEELTRVLRRFLDTYVPQAPAVLSGRRIGISRG